MNEQEARTILERLVFVIQKARSNSMESICGKREPNAMELSVLNHMDPLLFAEEGRPDLLTTTLKTIDKNRPIAPGEFYNVLCMVDKSYLTASIFLLSTGKDIPAVHPLPSWLGGWND